MTAAPTRPDRRVLHDHEPPRRASVLVRGLVAGALLLAAMVALRTLGPGADLGALPALQDFLTLSISVVVEALPFVVLGIAVSILVQVWLPTDRLLTRLPRNRVLRRALLSLLGVVFPVCECGNVPLARGLLTRGLSVPEAVTFLLAAPILNPVTIVVTYQVFGWENGILVARILGGFVIANVVGAVLERHPEPTRMLTPTFAAACATHEHEHGGRVERSARAFAEETGAMLPALLFGSAVAGAIQVGVPRDVLVALGTNPLWSVVALMVLAFVVALCSTADAFFILAFGATFLPGGVAAFLVFGPMIDVKMLALMRTTYTTRTLVLITAVVGMCVLVLGLAVNLLV